MENYKTHVNDGGLEAFHTFVKSRLSCVRLIERGTPIRGSQESYSPTSMTGTLRTAASISLTATRLVFRTNTPQTACLRHSKAMHLYHRYVTCCIINCLGGRQRAFFFYAVLSIPH